MKRLLIYTVIVLVVLSGFGTWVTYWSQHRAPRFATRMMRAARPDTDTPLARSIRLVGVQPDGSDDLLDADGKKIGEMFAFLGRSGRSFRDDRVVRTFVFELPRTADKITPFSQFTICAPGERYHEFGGGWRHAVVDDGDRRLVLYATEFRPMIWDSGAFGSERVPIDHVDVVLRLHQGISADQAVRFTGPFEPGATFSKTVRGNSYTLTIRPDRGNRVQFELASPGYLDSEFPLLVCDKAGEIYRADRHSYSGGPRGTRMKCSLRELTWEQVAAIGFSDRPLQKTFHNIRIRYTDRPEREYADYVYKMASALGRSPKDVVRSSIRTVEDAIKVLDVVRGEHVERAADRIMSNRTGRLTDGQRKKIRATASAWLAVPYPKVRLAGVRLGLKTGGGEPFFAAAIRLLSEEDSYVASQAASALGNRGQNVELPPAIAGQIKDRLLTGAARSTTPTLMRVLTGSRTPATTAALVELLGADGARPWIWWPAAEQLGRRKHFKDRTALPKELRLRLILAAGAQEGDGPLAAEAFAMLPGLMTAELLRFDGSVFTAVQRKLLAESGRPAATKAIVDFLRNTGAVAASPWALDRMVKQLNLWYDLDLGRLGWDARRQTPDAHKRDWPSIVGQAVAWYDGGGASKQPRPPGAGGPFGAAVELTVQGRSTSTAPCYVDLEDAEAFACPKDVYNGGSKKREQWCRTRGVDFRVYVYRSRRSLTCYGLSISPVPRRWWTSLTRSDLDRALDRSAKDHNSIDADLLRSLPATFAFRTREGGEGVLQVTAIDGKSRTMTIRYKMLK